MSRAIGRTLKQAGKGSQVSVIVYPSAGHDLSGDGMTPWDRYAEGSFDRKSTARATADAWLRTIGFFEDISSSSAEPPRPRQP